MGGADEEWVKAAMTDDTMVVELLVRLHRTASPPTLKPAPLQLEWSVRQRRSKSIPVTNNSNKPAAHRASPTTPLSWSASSSLSGGSGGGYEESIRPLPLTLSNITRSKVNGDSEKTISKRSRKKKTLPQLKEEEKLLVKERRELKRELTVLRMNVDKQRAANESLKRMKLELEPQAAGVAASILVKSVSGHQLQHTVAVHPVPSIRPQILLSKDMRVQPSIASENNFVLPDLNMPFDEDVACGVR